MLKVRNSKLKVVPYKVVSIRSKYWYCSVNTYRKLDTIVLLVLVVGNPKLINLLGMVLEEEISDRTLLQGASLGIARASPAIERKRAEACAMNSVVTAAMPAGLLLCILPSALAVDARGPDVVSNGNHLGGQSDDERSWHMRLALRSGAAELQGGMAEVSPSPRRVASKMMALGLARWPLPCRTDRASSAALGDAVTAAAAQDASATARRRGQLSHNESMCRSNHAVAAKASISELAVWGSDDPQHPPTPRRTPSFTKSSAQFKVAGSSTSSLDALDPSSTGLTQSKDNELRVDEEGWATGTAPTHWIQVRQQCLHTSSYLGHCSTLLHQDLSAASFLWQCVNPKAETSPTLQSGILMNGRRPCPPRFPLSPTNGAT